MDALAGPRSAVDALSRPVDGAGHCVPVLLLTGFLGAGKTSLLNHLLSGTAGLRVAAVVNDFGEIDVDATAVAGRVDSLVSLANGCLCCEVDVSELTEALIGLADPELGLDLVVIEASGLAEPAVLARMVHSAPREAVAYAGMVQVVDAAHLEEAVERHPRLGGHLAEADLVVVNKCDLVSTEQLGRVQEWIRQCAPRVAVAQAIRGVVPTGLLLGLAPDSAGAGSDCGCENHSDGCSHSDHLHDSYSAVTVVPGGPLHPRRMLTALSSPPAGSYRIKGTLTLATTEGPRRYQVAMVGRRLELRAGGEGAEGLVVIGIDLPPDTSRLLDSAVVEDGETVDPEALFGLHPFLYAGPEAEDEQGWIYDDARPAPRTSAAGMLSDPEDPDVADPAFTP